MFFRSERKLFGLIESKALTALPRDSRSATLAIESLERRESLSGHAVNPAVICGFNPQPDPPARSALIGHLDSATPLHSDVPPWPC